MAKGFDKLHIKSAVKARTKMDLSMSHLTTMDFGQIVPLYFNELVPGDKFSVKGNYFSRMAPLVKPTYGKFFFKTASFFVPFYQLADDAEAFVNGQTVWEGTSPYLRYISYFDFVNFFALYCDDSVTVSAGSEDWNYVDSNGTTQYVKFSPFGKWCLKVLNSLGYSIPTNVDLQSGSSFYSAYYSKSLNAMPLLAFAKAYNDYMSMSQRYNSSTLTLLLKCIKHNAVQSSISTYYNANTHRISAAGLNAIFTNIKLCYENDYFTSAWQNPNNPLSSSENVASLSVPGMGSLQSGINSDVVSGQSANISVNSSTYVGSLSQRMLDFLKSFDDWVRRNNYSGSRIVQKVYSRFGIKTEDFRSNYAHCIGTSSTPIQIGDVTATASTDATIGTQTYNNVVGDYAGKGIVSDGNSINYDSSDWGYLMVFGYYTVAPMMSYGFDRTVLRLEPLDFYTPEFDGLGADAISAGEVYASPIASEDSDTSLDNAVFGYTERYNAYRYGRDKITGEFRSYRNGSDMNVWHSGRLLGTVRANNQLVAQSISMNQLPVANSEYNRIFSVVDGENDHFYLTAQFKVDAVRPMLSLNQVPNLGEGNTVVSKNGNEIS